MHEDPHALGRRAGESRRRREAITATWNHLVAPREDGLPNRRVLAAPLVLLAAAFVALVALGLTGSSTGILHSYFEAGPDPDLVSGAPQAIRSDEWYVQSSWTISQVEQGMPVLNESFPGGMDATVQHDLPAWDWSLALRPQLWGFTFLPLDQAMAWKWWLPALSLVAAVYLFAVTMLPRRPVTAALLGVGFLFQPFFQWWWLSATFWPATWALLVCATTVWLLRSRHRTGRIVLPAVTGLATVAMATGIYVPFIVPAAFVAIAFCVGMVVRRDGAGRRFGQRLRAVVPLFVAGAAAGLVMVVWLATRWDTIESFTGTVYPGERLQETGSISLREVVALFAAPVTSKLGLTSGAPLGSNQSEAATVFLVGLFLIVPCVWWLFRDRRQRRATDWTIVALLAVGVLFAVFMVVPHWDAIAHLLLLDRTTMGRLRLGLGLLSLILIVVAVARADEGKARGERVPWVVAGGAGALALVATGVVVGVLFWLNSPLVVGTRTWIVVAVLLVASTVLFARGLAATGAAAFMAMALIGSAGVNPLYVGVYDLNETEVVSEMKQLDGSGDDTWVGVGDTFLPTVTLVQSGLRSLNGFQSSPSDDMWEQIDPRGVYEARWNRLANVSWGAGSGDPVPVNPAPDQIHLNFDSCSTFAQDNVEWVLADERLDQGCATLETKVDEGSTTFWIYRVTPRG